MKRLFKWALCGFLVVVVLIVAGLLLMDTIARKILESRLSAETGMNVRIGKLVLGLRNSSVLVENIKINNTAQFGGSPFLEIPEIYLQIDKDAMRAGKVHLKELRLNMREIDLVQDKKGQWNVQSLEDKSKEVTEAAKSQTQKFAFDGIDKLSVTFQTLRVSSLEAPEKTTEVNFGLTNQVFYKVNTESNLNAIAVLLALRSHPTTGSGSDPVDLTDLLKGLIQ